MTSTTAATCCQRYIAVPGGLSVLRRLLRAGLSLHGTFLGGSCLQNMSSTFKCDPSHPGAGSFREGVRLRETRAGR